VSDFVREPGACYVDDLDVETVTAEMFERVWQRWCEIHLVEAGRLIDGDSASEPRGILADDELRP
jgi:hypothetical protein